MKNYDSPEDRDKAFRKKRQQVHDESMAKFGWYANYVPNHGESPTGFSTHTYGLDESWSHANIQIVWPVPPDMGYDMLHTVVELIRKGKRFEPGRKYTDVLHDYDVMFAWATESGRRVLRMILPDKKNGVARDEIRKPFSKQWEGTEE
jgi:uncharacterized protein DUF4262